MGIANWASVEDAIQAQVALAAGLTGDRVLWEFQSRDMLRLGSGGTKEFITMRIDGLSSTNPETVIANNPSGVPGSGSTPGTELLSSAVIHTDFKTVLNFYSMSPSGAGSAFARLASVRGYLGRESVAESLDQLGVALVDFSAISHMPAVLETEFESRASFEITARVADGDQETSTYIQSAQWTGTLI